MIIRIVFFILLFPIHGIYAETIKPSPKKSAPTESSKITSISSNPAAVNVSTGTGIIQRFIEKKLGIEHDHGIMLQGAWIGDTNNLFSGGITDAKRVTSNSALLVDLNIDMKQFNGWPGGLFSAQFLQQNAQNTNAQAGLIQGYNSLPDVAPFNRSELYALWYRQALFDDKLFVRIGKTITTLDFNNVIKPVSLSAGEPNIPAVTSLIYTPVFINPAVDGVMPGYTNSAYGLTLNFTPTNKWYLTYGIYDGNLASGKQTGLSGPTFNGRYFQVAETGGAWLVGKKQVPGTAGIGLWHQKGLIRQQHLSEMEATGAYLFGSQRLWYRHPGFDISGISAFYQLSINNSSVLPMNKSIGAGLTAFGLIANREADSLGIGSSLAWLNRHSTDRPTELMFQMYYQAQIIPNIFLEPALSYIPTPGQSSSLPPAFAGTIRAIILA
ncbi:carbohydrate porin [Legionella bononiensis]|uniref:Carbohydrate porin n=1 Tax=Legionella bononiensis TaxID=2793102 RepID=A0ABS1WDZ2_9GAMM|nr:carbohydrate porin [Legionella bononiensis]MBL7479584.1 carbohydrate porin [Legionella bononiensis]MBL7527539.1 carbohydrate porin [Legionella bononiensis]